MKKKSSKLRLKKNTLTHLTPLQLHAQQGGYYTVYHCHGHTLHCTHGHNCGGY